MFPEIWGEIDSILDLQVQKYRVMWLHMKKNALQIVQTLNSLVFMGKHDHFRLQWVGIVLQHCQK